jgi:chemotaxis protein CheC
MCEERPELKLTEAQQDTLNEYVNIGFGRAASALSMLVNRRVLLNVPQLQLCTLENVGASLGELRDRELVNVHQVFSGKLSGHALLLMDVTSAAVLVDLLNGGVGQAGPITAGSQEALTEVGNIVVNAFLGAFGNLLKIHLSFTAPTLRIENLMTLVKSLAQNEQKANLALVVKIRFHLALQEINGYLVVVMGDQALQRLLQAVDDEKLLD